MNEQERIMQLRDELHRHNYLYYVKNEPEITDLAFDQLLHELQQLEAHHPELYDANSPTMRVGSDISRDFTQIAHERPMLSLGNTYNRQEVADFYRRVQEGLGNEPFEICLELKFDGLSISLIYEDGHLLHAVTRGDGVKGDDVTANVRTIRSIPLTLPRTQHYPQHFEVRGEILMPWDSFEQLNREKEERGEPLFANPRNAASGTLKSKQSAVVASRKLDAFFYAFYSDEPWSATHTDGVQQLSQWGFKVADATCVAHTLDDIYAFIDDWDLKRHQLPFATDGVVLKVNALQQQATLGITSKSPRWAIAYKFQPEQATTRLCEVTYQVGRTGAVTPVANMEPVRISGTMVRRASLHNADYISALDLHVGDMVQVEKAGEIIPQIVGVAKHLRNETLGERVSFISLCPECATPLVRYEGEAATYCPNENHCPPQVRGRIEHFVSREAMNIDTIGPETIRHLYEKGLIHNVADLYQLTLTDVCGEDSGREVSASKMIAAIADSCKVTFDRVLYALGIRFVGRVAAKQIARHFGSMEQLTNATLEQLLEVEGVGKTIAESVLRYMNSEDNRLLIRRLQDAGVTMEMEQTAVTSAALAGKTIVITGTFNKHSREEYKMLIEQHGGKLSSSISKKTTFVLAGEGVGPSKLEKATTWGIPLVDEHDFLQMIAIEQTSQANQPLPPSLPAEQAIQLSLFDDIP